MFQIASTWARRQIARAGLPLTQGGLGFDCSGHLTTGYLMRHIAAMPQGVTELFCHPGAEDPHTQERYGSWGYRWQQELAALTGDPVRREVERAGVRLTSFGELSRLQQPGPETAARDVEAPG